MINPDNTAESYIFLYTDDYLADDNVWNRRCYPQHYPEEEVDDKSAGKSVGPGDRVGRGQKK